VLGNAKLVLRGLEARQDLEDLVEGLVAIRSP